MGGIHEGEKAIGRLVEGAVLKVIGPDGAELEPGRVGELYMRQTLWPDFDYHGNRSAREAIEADGLVTVGDVGLIDADGYLFIKDRVKDMVISGGANIYPAEIEAVLITMPGVADCAVIGVPDAEFGERLLAFITVQPDARLDETQVINWLKRRIAGYKVPRQVVFRDNLPREDSGKIFKKKLRAEFV